MRDIVSFVLLIVYNARSRKNITQSAKDVKKATIPHIRRTFVYRHINDITIIDQHILHLFMPGLKFYQCVNRLNDS